jgi:ferrous iron transport protein A
MILCRSRRSTAGTGSGEPLPRTLADLSPGTEADIVALDPAAAEDVLTRLHHLGFRAGTRVIKLRTAPLGDPAVYRLLGYDICLRRHEAAYVRIADRS